jgi:hypothetical protein
VSVRVLPRFRSGARIWISDLIRSMVSVRNGPRTGVVLTSFQTLEEMVSFITH